MGSDHRPFSIHRSVIFSSTLLTSHQTSAQRVIYLFEIKNLVFDFVTYTHKVGNNGTNVNSGFPYICNFLHCFYLKLFNVLVNMKLN